MDNSKPTSGNIEFSFNQGLAYLIGLPTMMLAPMFYWQYDRSLFGPSGLTKLFIIAGVGGMISFALFGGRRRWAVGGLLGLLGGLGAAGAHVLYTTIFQKENMENAESALACLAGAGPAMALLAYLLKRDKRASHRTPASEPAPFINTPRPQQSPVWSNDDDYESRAKVYIRRGAKVLAVVFWTAVVGFLAGDRAYNIFQEDPTSRFPTLEGTVVEAELVRDTRIKSHNYYEPSVRFTYEINGRTTTGQQYRFGSPHSLDDNGGAEFRGRYYPGAKVRVFYDPNHPYNAALVAGINDADLCIFGLFLPFNAASILFWAIIFRWLWRRLSKIPRGGVRIRLNRGEILVSLPELTPAGLAGWTLMIGSCLAMVAYIYLPAAFPVKQNGITYLLGPITVLAALIVGAYAWKTAWQNKGPESLIIASKSLSLPVNFGRTTRKSVVYEDITRFLVCPRERFYHKFSTTSYEVFVQHGATDDYGQNEKLAEWYDRDKATAFSDWLAEEVTIRCLEIKSVSQPKRDEPNKVAV